MLTIVGGVFYIIGGAVVAAVVDSLSSGLGGLGGLGGVSFLGPFELNNTNSGLGSLTGLGSGSVGTIADVLLVIGLITGGLIIFGGILINSESSGRRKAGGILAAVMILLGSLTTLGGLLIGFILTVIGGYLGLTYKSNSRMVIGLGPIGSVHLGPEGSPQSGTPAGTGPLNYCIKCGSRIRPGAVFCGACGARIVE